MRSEVQKLPAGFLERLRKIIPPQKFDAIANTFSESKPTTFRINRLKAESPRAIRECIEELGFRLDQVSWYPDAFILKEGRLRDLQETEIYKNGEIYVQNLSSMIPPLALDPKPGEKILDLAAAPGSKTTQIASLMGGKGEVVAVDNNKIRFFRLKANLELQGASNVKPVLAYGESIGRKFPNYFDKVLLDAPCSSEGRFDVHNPKSFGYWKPRKVSEMAQKQKKLFYSAVLALREGGILVYSTCTFAPEENEEILDWALQKFKGGLEIIGIVPAGGETRQERRERPLQLIPNQMAGLTQWEEKKLDSSVAKAVRILPTCDMEGFFVARLRKTRVDNVN